MIDQNNLKTSLSVLRAITHPVRLAILAFVDKHKRINVNKIYNTLKLEQSITSQHLRILRLANIVETQREGKFIYYTINYKKAKSVMDIVTEFLDKK